MIMSENDTTTTATPTEAPAKGTWQATLARSEAERVKGEKATKQAGALLWKGAKDAVSDWIQNRADTDDAGEGLYSDAMLALGGQHRKGDASKIKTVAIATRDHGLLITEYPNLAKAYAEAYRLTKTVHEESDEDAAAETAVSQIEVEADLSGVSPAAAAALVMKQGLDPAAALLVDALGTDVKAHRAFLRSLSQEVAGRVRTAEALAKEAEKEAREQAKEQAKAEAKDGVEAAPKKATPKKAVAKPASEKAKPTKGKATPKKAAAKPEPVEETLDDMIDGLDGDDISAAADAFDAEVEAEVEVEAKPATKKAAPRRGPVRRATPRVSA